MTYDTDFTPEYEEDFDEYPPEEYLTKDSRFITPLTHLGRVNGNLNSPDSHADDACDLLQDLVDLVRTHNPGLELEPEHLREVLPPLFALCCPQYLAVLGKWNYHLSDKEVEDFALESHLDTVVTYLD